MAAFEPMKIKKAEQVPPVVLLYGKENYLIDTYFQHLIDVAVPRDMRDFNLDILYGTDVSAQKVIAIARSYPMMAERRMVVIKDVHKMSPTDLKGLAQYSEKPTDTTSLVLLAQGADMRKKALATLKKNSASIECKPLYDNQIEAWLVRELKQKEYTIDRDAAALLALQVGTNLQDLVNEIEKLLLYIGERRHITAADVGAIAGVRNEFSIFALQNALGRRDLKRVLYIYKQLRLTMNVQAMIFQLTKFFTNLLIAREFNQGNKAELAKLTRTSVYFVGDLIAFSRKYSLKELTDALDSLRTADYNLKTWPVDEKLMMEMLFTHIVKGYEARHLPFASRA